MPPPLPLALATPGFEGGRIKVTVLRAPGGPAATARVTARAGNGRSFGESTLKFAAGATKAEGVIELPIELRNEVGRIAIEGERNAAAAFLMDDRWRRKTVGLMSGTSAEMAQPLLSPLYYVSRALEPYAEMSEPDDTAALKSLLDQGLSMLVLADIGVLPGEQQEMIAHWVDNGGVLLRFAGPRLAGAQDGLVPVTLREGDRSLGSALSWETPQPLQAFPEKSPFAGLAARPVGEGHAPGAGRARCRLPGQGVGEPRRRHAAGDRAASDGKGLIVLFHVTANADWSNLPVSGLFVEMLRRVLDLAPAAGGGASASARPRRCAGLRTLPGARRLRRPDRPLARHPAHSRRARSTRPRPPPRHRAGLYRRGEQERAINITRTGDALTPIAGLPAGVTLRALAPLPRWPLAPYAFALAMLLFLADCLAALFLGGGLDAHAPAPRRGGGRCMALALIAAWQPHPAMPRRPTTSPCRTRWRRGLPMSSPAMPRSTRSARRA